MFCQYTRTQMCITITVTGAAAAAHSCVFRWVYGVS